MYILRSLQLQFSPFQRLIWLLKIESVLACLIIFGKVDLSLFPWKRAGVHSYSKDHLSCALGKALLYLFAHASYVLCA